VLSVKIKCSHILVGKQSEALAVLARIKAGEKFGKLAKEISTDSGSAKRDGNLGYFTKGKMVKQFEDAAFKLQVGEISGPVKSEYGYHIIKRLG
jgi:foldase protein PrsA